MLYFGIRYTKCSGHPPCEDVDWNFTGLGTLRLGRCHPPCEDVDWNFVMSWAIFCSHVILRVRMWIEIAVVGAIAKDIERHPPCEDVDWNFLILPSGSTRYGHPPCEDVDWNYFPENRTDVDRTSSSVWGCGLKSDGFFYAISSMRSSSVWGCGLKSSCKSLYSLAPAVIFHVRMWIEIAPYACSQTRRRRHPLREGVDWNFMRSSMQKSLHRSPSTWGCGLKSANCSSNIRFRRVALRAKTVPVFFVCTMTAACIFYNMPLYTYYVYKGIYTIGSGKYFGKLQVEFEQP